MKSLVRKSHDWKEIALTPEARLQPANLFAALDLDRAGLAAVKARVEKGDEPGALEAFLAYYRARTNVWIPIDDALKIEKPAPAETLRHADDLLRHVFLARPNMRDLGYAPQDYGPDIDWSANPVDDVSWLSCMHRFDWDTFLASAFAATTNDRYAAGWIELTGDWIAKHPADAERTVYAYNSLGIGVRAWHWCADFELYKRSPAFATAFLRTFLAAVHDQAEVISASARKFSHHNPTIVEADGLLRIGIVFPEFRRAAAWRERATGLLSETLGRQFTADGVQREWSINYHMACAGLLLNVAELLRRNGSEAPPGFMDAIGRMYDYLLAALSPDRLYPMFSDARRPGHDIAGALRRGAAVFDRPQYLAVLEERANESPRQLSYAFPEAGIYYLRSGWDRGAIYAAFHCSPKAASSHDQPDNGTFELFAHGSWVMPDSGCYAYGHGTEFETERPWFCSTAVHQTLTLDGKNSVNAARHRLWHDEPRHTALVFENESYPGWTHRRTVFFVDRSFLVLVDEALGEPRGMLDLHFQLAPGPAALEATNRTARTAGSGGGNVLVWTPPDAPVALIEEKGQTSSKFHVK
ncbi:MAG: alginate lyase family protein, partial [Lentisphaerae bacterium]|nr:alginate lyase family protein [Lentisphaerota bacterium]